MANPEHIAKLQEGVEAWNEWRQKNPDERPNFERARRLSSNLQRADLHGADLRGAMLSGRDLAMANLTGSDLSGALMRYANLNHAEMNGANLTGADLYAASMLQVSLADAILDRANLTVAMVNGDFRRAKLTFTNLSSTHFYASPLDDADFQDARCDLTVFANVDLSRCKRLAGVNHWGPSTVGTDTLYRSNGRIPKLFLRGCGLSDWEIEAVSLYRKALSTPQIDGIVYRIAEFRYGQSIQFYSCFISYSTRDQEFADRVWADLQDKGVRCWFAPHDVRSGKKLHEQIDQAIRLYDKLLLILSEHSMNSEWVKTEIAHGRQKELNEGRQVLFPITLIPFANIRDWKCFDADTGKDSAREIREYFIPDFSNWEDHDSYQHAFARLLKDLKAEKPKAATLNKE